ncbi:MAG: osmotically inducible protein OsmC [Candidatus Marinimicrobia bacterium CG08_land_8_20_14_0_20_45_22]|nr:MAG: osmotically inducible protein OsmC [Candidatus Marinimicrobia bacterium CG08_land_8_20_14_0_20_45_22]
MKVQILRAKNSTFIAKGDSNHWVVIDTEKEFGGSEAGSRPMEMLLSSLGGCTGIDVETLLNKMRATVDDFQIDIQAERRSEHPRIFTQITIRFLFWGEELNADAIHKAVRLSSEKYCPVTAMLRQSVPITTEILLNPPKEDN